MKIIIGEIPHIIMSVWLLVLFLLATALALNELDHALMVFQIRESMGFAPIAAMHLGSVIAWVSQGLIAMAVVIIVRSFKVNNDD